MINPLENKLLNVLPLESKGRIFTDLNLIHLPLGKVIYESGQDLEFVYFPADGIISLFYITEDGHSSQISAVGSEGVVGITAFMGGGSTPYRAEVQSAGFFYRLSVTAMLNEFNLVKRVRIMLLSYTQSFIAQMAQTAACNRHHSIDQQLCRLLLLSMDRMENNDLTMTQESIANMLGVRREGVTEAAGKLQKQNVITYSRGKITVTDRKKLEKLSCECYDVVKNETDRLDASLPKLNLPRNNAPCYPKEMPI
ncbi:Crp/Fnr family transcriptional regulator [Paraglaciecola sp. 25GB23A]|uniref:Crp/Fnr family transcriptional regulator n=1 Tax=Paraglaciecola sp. 25GB23A TaxID=3156068 RepID=UPI0032AEF4D7